MEAAPAGVVGAEDAARFKRAFTDFLDSSTGRKDYGAKVRELVDGMLDAERGAGETPARRLFVDLGDLRGFDAGLAKELMDMPSDCIEVRYEGGLPLPRTRRRSARPLAHAAD